MSKVEVLDYVDVSFSDSSDPVVIVADFEVEVIQTFEEGPPGLTGPAGPQGIQGPPGKDGTAILSGTVPPTSEDGEDGDFYYDTTTDMMYGPKAGGAWPPGASLVGDPGPRGSLWHEGAGAPGVIAGALAEDNYLNTTNGDVYSYSGSSWGSPVGNIRGPQGIQGVPGPGIPEAPIDGVTYGRKDAAWVPNVATGAVRYDTVQALTTAQRTQARSNIAAAPFDALAYNGIQLNGAMEVSQELGTAGVVMPSATLKNIVDGWQTYFVCATGSITASQVDVAAYFSGQPSGFPNALVMNPTVGVPCSNNGEYALFRHNIEGQRLARLAWGTANAQPLTYGFWFYCTVAGVIFVKLMNGSTNRFFFQEQTVPAGWNFLTGTIPGDTTGTWNAATGVGARFDVFVAGKGATIGPTAGAWGATDATRTANNTNLIAANANIVGITGFVLLPGIELPSSARLPFIKRRSDQEEFDAQRYLWVLAPGIAGVEAAMGVMASATQSYFFVPFPRRMRATPSMSISAVADWQIEPFVSGSSNQLATAFQAANMTPISFRCGFSCNNTAATSGAGAMLYTAGVNAKIIADARL